MRAKKEKPSKWEATFKASKRIKNKEYKSSASDEEEAHFKRKLKKGFNEHKGKYPLSKYVI